MVTLIGIIGSMSDLQRDLDRRSDHEGLKAANHFFSMLLSAMGKVDMERRYAALDTVFQNLLDQNTDFARIRLVGPFAKTDYLLKTHDANGALSHAVHTARIHFRDLGRGETPSETASRYDFQAVTCFVALIYHIEEIPERLRQLFPPMRPQSVAALPRAAVMRLLVEHWDDEFIYGLLEDPTIPAKVRYHADEAYLRDDLYQGVQLNLIHPRQEDDGTLTPELIIFAPDLLIDISAIAGCFESYNHTELIYLLNKIKPNVTTEPILMGEFAGELLDDEVHAKDQEKAYVDCARHFFTHHAVDLLCTPLSPDFHHQAQQQRTYIRQAVRQTLPQRVKEYHREEVMLEPSFFSEMLGLQGRMDFLQQDLEVLIEQKAGKGGFPQRDPDTPVYQLKHYIQMLLYMALLRYGFADHYDRYHHLYAFLLYSRYANSLVGLGYAPQLVREALMIRNRIAANELRFTHGGMRILETLRPEDLNAYHTAGKLWNNYQRPQLEALLAPIHKASPLERDYYFRFLQFVETEHVLSKVGNALKEDSGFAAKWHDNLHDKRQAGNIFDNLILKEPGEGHQGEVTEVVLERHDDEEGMSNFRIGDIVILYPYEKGTEPDVRKTWTYRCSIRQITATTLTLTLRAAQSDARVFLRDKDKVWAVEHDFFESSYGALYRGMHAFLSAPKERRDLILLQRRPRVDHSLTLRGNYGSFNTLSLHVRQARDFFLIIGPPGTGKTSFGLMNTLKEELQTPGSNILLMAFTNRAVDEICSKLEEEHLDYLRVGSRLSCSVAYQSHLLEETVSNCHTLKDMRRRVLDCRIVVGTTTALSSKIQLFSQKTFALAIIDEASQILEPHLMALLSAVHTDPETGIEESAIRKFVFIGDHKQLPAVVQQSQQESRVEEDDLNAIGLTDCRLSLFERLLRRYRNDPEVVYMLTRQGRMHHEIAVFPSEAFYGGKLREVPLPHQTPSLPSSWQGKDELDDVLHTRRVAFFDCQLPEDSCSDKVNTIEADLIAATIQKIWTIEKAHFIASQTVGVIVPYRNQIAAIRNALERFNIPELMEITIDTVERYQGSQRKYILYGFTVQQFYQLRFLTNHVFEEDGAVIDRKLNVVMTRAQEHLLLFGHAALLKENALFDRLIDFCKERGEYYSTQEDSYNSQ
ncbi:MAG: AAA domain-containing protein [Prevotella sp.]|nr:AAA domain-containing protein [Prevotella sp.]